MVIEKYIEAKKRQRGLEALVTLIKISQVLSKIKVLKEDIQRKNKIKNIIGFLVCSINKSWLRKMKHRGPTFDHMLVKRIRSTLSASVGMMM